MSIDAMNQALEALKVAEDMQEERSIRHEKILAAYDALRAATAGTYHIGDDNKMVDPVANDRTMTVVYRNVTPEDARYLMEHSKAVWFGWCHAPYERDDARRLLKEAAHPPRREWVGLTDDEIAKTCGFCEYTTSSTRQTLSAIARAIEAKLKERNK